VQKRVENSFCAVMQIKLFDEFQVINRDILSRATGLQRPDASVPKVDDFGRELLKAEIIPQLKTGAIASGAGAQPEIPLRSPSAEIEINKPARLIPAPVPQIKTATKHYEGVGKLTSQKASLSGAAIGKDTAHLESTIKEMGRRVGLDPLLGLAVARTESSLRPGALSTDGFNTKGLFQLKDSTGLEVMNRLGLEGRYSPYDPEQNSHLGLSHLLELHKLFKSGGQLVDGVTVAAAADSSSVERFALAAFNAGQGRVAEAQQKAKAAGFNPSDFNQVKDLLPEITRNYVDRVLAERALSAQLEGQDE
jgi:hypothetical protein